MEDILSRPKLRSFDEHLETIVASSLSGTKVLHCTLIYQAIIEEFLWIRKNEQLIIVLLELEAFELECPFGMLANK